MAGLFAQSAAERAERIAELERRAFALELEEESLVEQALDAKIEVHRRVDANPFAVLGIVLPDPPALAEAAE
jgi:hypothetical protein